MNTPCGVLGSAAAAPKTGQEVGYDAAETFLDPEQGFFAAFTADGAGRVHIAHVIAERFHSIVTAAIEKPETSCKERVLNIVAQMDAVANYGRATLSLAAIQQHDDRLDATAITIGDAATYLLRPQTDKPAVRIGEPQRKTTTYLPSQEKCWLGLRRKKNQPSGRVRTDTSDFLGAGRTAAELHAAAQIWTGTFALEEQFTFAGFTDGPMGEASFQLPATTFFNTIVIHGAEAGAPKVIELLLGREPMRVADDLGAYTLGTLLPQGSPLAHSFKL